MARRYRKSARSASLRRTASRSRSGSYRRSRGGVRQSGRSFRSMGRRGYARGGVQTVRIVLDNTQGAGAVAPGPEGVGLVRAGMPRKAMF